MTWNDNPEEVRGSLGGSSVALVHSLDAQHDAPRIVLEREANAV